jgi:hypothetical protein
MPTKLNEEICRTLRTCDTSVRSKKIILLKYFYGATSDTSIGLFPVEKIKISKKFENFLKFAKKVLFLK